MAQVLYENRRYLLWGLYILAAVLILSWLSPIIAEKNPSRIVQSTISGVLVGGIYALVALGIVIINKSSGVFNFAHGWMMLVGGLIFWSFFTTSEISLVAAGILSTLLVLMIFIEQFSFRNPRHVIGGVVAIILLSLGMTIGGSENQWLHAVIGTVTGAVLVGLLVERLTIRPLIGQPLFTAVLMTLAVAEVLRGFTQITWGSRELSLPIVQNITERLRDLSGGGIDLPQNILINASDTFLNGRIVIQMNLLVAFILSIIAFIAFILFFRFTNIGLAMRATSEDQQLAQSTGLRVRFILATAWGIATLLAAVAGILQGGASGLSLNMPLVALRAFPAVLLGGLESIGGALVGGLVIGLVESYGTLLFPNQVGTDLAPYLVLMVVLIVKPEGLFGQERIERI